MVYKNNIIIMKKVLLLFTIFLGSIAISNAQIVTTPQTSANVGSTPIQKGSWLTGAGITNLGYDFENKGFSFNLTPRVGYFLSHGIAVGAAIDFGAVFQDDEKPIWNYGVMPFVRYYFPEGANETGRFFAEGDVGFKGAAVNGSSDSGFAFGVNVGYAHFITRSVALEGTIGYNYAAAIQNINNGNKQSGLGFGLGFQIYIPQSK